MAAICTCPSSITIARISAHSKRYLETMAVSDNLTIWSGNYTLDSGDSLGPFHVNLHVNKSYSAMACVKYPFALLYGN